MEPDILKVLNQVDKARQRGYSIVPMIGSGFSVESGIPTKEHLVRYLAKFRSYLQRRAYLPSPDRSGENGAGFTDLLHRWADRYARQPTLFVRHHGWPDRFQLNEDLGRAIRLEHPQRELEGEVLSQLNSLAKELYLDRVKELERWRRHQPGSPRKHPREQYRSQLWDLFGDWRDLLRLMTDSDTEYADALFSRIGEGRRPGVSHRFLAFLVGILGIRLVLTTAFDSLLDDALRVDHVPFRRVEVTEGWRFPVHSLPSGRLAVVRLYGHSRQLLLHAGTDQPLTEELRKEFLASLPERALLLVMGSSGQDRLALELLDAFLASCRDARSPQFQRPWRTDPPLNVHPRLIWVHHEARPPPAARRLAPPDDPLLLFTRAFNPGLFLSHLYYYLTGRYPASREPYPAHIIHPIGITPRGGLRRRPEGGEPRVGVLIEKAPAAEFYLFSRSDGAARPDEVARAPAACERLAEFVNKTSHLPIWIDLEEQYSLAGVVGAILDQCRNYDSDLPPSVLPLEHFTPQPADDAEAEAGAPADSFLVQRAVDLVTRALSRTRYIVALDSLEAYVWPPTCHHGVPSAVEMRGVRQRLGCLRDFIIGLANNLHQTGSKVCVSVNKHVARRKDGDSQRDGEITGAIRGVVEAIRRQVLHPEDRPRAATTEVWEDPQPTPPEAPTPPAAEPSDGLLGGVRIPPELRLDGLGLGLPGAHGRLVLLALSCYRRTRHLVSLRIVLGPHCRARPEPELVKVDAVLAELCRSHILLAIEGGGYWMPRTIRDELYGVNSSRLGVATVGQTLRASDRGWEAWQEPLTQLLLMIHFHDSIARTYYFDNFLHSADAFAFFEYVYHRISSTRYLTQLLLLDLLFEHRYPGEGRQELWKRVLQLREAFPDNPQSRYRGFIQALGDAAPSGGDRLRQILQTNRLGHIGALRRAIRQDKNRFLRSVPAEQTLAWCEWILANDIDRIDLRALCRVLLQRSGPTFSPAEPIEDPFWNHFVAGGASEAKQTFFQALHKLDEDSPAHRLREVFEALAVGTFHERGDYLASARRLARALQTPDDRPPEGGGAAERRAGR